ncbi:thrombopoietin isoform X2 [Boleophthalmus pectinirostris]|uniref:thrombopoietin isoform X2 n=1 Tax=Boleophthalmus pectinirostris TaxID=150288 RepID=UPI00242CFED0|nr:thrombopoietin isoform X2 [Boleophthalmus pectinirostris]XP_055007748.1 thrombopoietin isoform X2 [Boleophthalmus pectinirostris]
MAVGSLLLLCVATSWPWDAQTLYIDFVCNKPVREALNIVSQMESELLLCEELVTLPTAVQLPCTALHVATWGNKSLQEKREDLVASLRLLTEGVNAVSALSQSACAASVLRRLQHNINNYLLILLHLDLSYFQSLLCSESILASRKCSPVSLCDPKASFLRTRR